jgi:hypothetical protein
MVNEECMHLNFPKSFQPAAAVLLASLHLSSAWAQTETRPDVSKAEKPVELIYQSSFLNYQRYSASDIQSWKQANDTVKDIGGWRAYAKEITQDQNEKPVVPVHSHGAHQ